MNRAPWRAEAACRPEAKPAHLTLSEWVNLWFPGQGGDYALPLSYCATCPVTEQCCQAANHEGETMGVWGGLSNRQRQRLTLTVKSYCRQCQKPYLQPRRQGRGGTISRFCSDECRNRRDRDRRNGYQRESRAS